MSNQVTIFQIENRIIRVLNLKRRKNNISVDSFFSVTFPETEGTDPAKISKEKGDVLKNALKEHKIKTGDSILVLPKHNVTMRHVFLPSVEQDELKQMARFEAEKHIPFNAERHIISHYVMRKDGVTGSHVLISASDSPMVEEPLSILNAAGVDVNKATVSTLGLYNLFKAGYEDVSEQSTITLLHIGMQYIEMVVIHEGMLIFARSTSNAIEKLFTQINETGDSPRKVNDGDIEKIDLMNPGEFFGNAGRKSLEQDVQSEDDIVFQNEQKDKTPSPKVKIVEKWKERLLHSIRTTYDFARREYDLPQMDRIYVSGEGAHFENITEFLNTSINIEADKLKMPESLSESAVVPGRYYPEIGSGLEYFKEDIEKINLLPPSYIEKKEAREKRQSYVSLAVMIAGVLILGFTFYRSYISKQEKLTRWYEKRINTIGPEVKNLTEMQNKIGVIRRYVKDPRNALAILNTLSNWDYIPDRVTLMDFKYSKDETVEISGHAFTIKDLNQFIADLENSGYFTKVDIRQRPWVNLPNNRQPKVLNYSLVCFLPGEDN